MSDPSSTQPSASEAPPGGPAAPQQAPPVPEAELRGASGPSGPRAGFWQRVGATIVDTLVLLVPIVILVVAIDSGVASLLAIVISAAYFIVMEGGPTGQTVGKRALGIRVIGLADGRPIGYGRATIRYLVEAILSGNIIFLGYLWMLWDREKQTWHDKAASSVVVPVDVYPVQR